MTATAATATTTDPHSSTNTNTNSGSNSRGGPALRRRDGRQPLELRGRELKVSLSSQFDGSCFYSQGNSAVQVNIHGPVTASRKAGAGEDAYARAAVRVRVLHVDSMPTAGGAERMNQNERRAVQNAQHDVHELLTLLESLVEAVFLSERFPRSVLCIDVCILSEDGALVATCVNAVMAALLDAGVPCRTTMAAVGIAAMIARRDAETQQEEASGEEQAQPMKKRRRSPSPPPPSSSPRCNTTEVPVGNEEREGEELEVVYLLDPIASEERSSVESVSLASATTTTTSAPGPTGGGAKPTTGKKSTMGEDYVCLAHGVFVFSNPSCGGGLLASHVHRACHVQRHVDSRTGETHGGEAAAVVAAERTTTMKKKNLSVAQWTAMSALAERAAVVVFHFFRQCNVPLE